MSQAVNLIKQHGILGLGGGSGCACTRFEVCGVQVSTQCHRPSGGPSLTVEGNGDVEMDELRLVAAAALKSLRNHWRYTEMKIDIKCRYQDVF